MRALARLADDLARQTRATATDVRAARRVDWVSTRAEQHRRDLEAHARDIDVSAGELEDAARALRQHADAVEDRMRQISSAMHSFGNLLDAARRTVAGAADGVADTATEQARALLRTAQRAPGPGSTDWPDFLSRFGR